MKTCRTCNVQKDESCFYWERAICKPCLKIRYAVETECIDCGEKRIVRRRYGKQKATRCFNCSQKFEKNKPEVREKYSILARAQVLRQGGVPNAKKFVRGGKSGDKHHNWRGGVTTETNRIRQSYEMKEWEKAVLVRDKYTCKGCGQVGGQLHIHHIKAFSMYPELRFDLDNGETLCLECHKKTDTYLYKAKRAMLAE